MRKLRFSYFLQKAGDNQVNQSGIDPTDDVIEDGAGTVIHFLIEERGGPDFDDIKNPEKDEKNHEM